MPAPEADFTAALSTAVPALVVGECLFAGPPLAVQTEVPPDAVFCLQSGGAAPAPYLNNTSDFRRSSIQVVVRNEELAAGRALVDSIMAAMHRRAVAGYAYCTASAEPVFLGQDDDNRLFEWSLNFELGWPG